MSLLLNIDTALDTASVCLAKDGLVLQLAINENQKDHAAWLHPAIDDLLQKNNFKPGQLEAVAVSIGPGSYTGLRVGLAAAKGLCYALQIPLITIPTLKMMAYAVREEATELICPLIDARRMEVFAAVYDRYLQEKVPAHTLVIDDTSFAALLSSNKILFCGNGCLKLQPLLTHPNAFFSTTRSNAADLATLSHGCFGEKEFADLAYTEPLYIKEFYSPARKG
ncbi:MAG: tRNA (adenosine(37)-N6)-threonylcarbamoyltransferase complex dimerization subunit type 1 TsaB [Ferruginibacter sp.]|nr:tRNA (adenosine(37)-N6)-threonylcarbamoyltransferase complex dimerization subunit type 1 TsaB [Chitinophagaceae bacterium]